MLVHSNVELKTAGGTACPTHSFTHSDTRGGAILSKSTIKLKKDLWDRIKRCSDAAGYSGPQEFVEHVLEKELAKLEDAESDEEIVNKLKGLGYLE